MTIKESVASTAGRRLVGKRATRSQALLAAAVAALAAGTAVYRLLRTGDESSA